MDRIKNLETVQEEQERISLKKYYHISRFTLRELLDLGIQIAGEIEKYAGQGKKLPVINLDHIFLSQSQGWKLRDFELSETMETIDAGKDGDYGMPPEYYAGQAVDEIGKIYELGILLYRMLNYMELPFEDISQSTWEAEQLRRNAVLPKAPRFGTDSLQKVICIACASREKRYHSMSEFRTHLAYLKGHLPVEWLDTAITGHTYKDGDYIHRVFEPETIIEVEKPVPVKKEEAPVQVEKPEKDKKIVSDEKKRQKAVEKEKLKKQKENEKAIRDAQKKQQREQEEKYGNQNKKDMYLVIGIVIAFIAVIVLVITFVGNSKNNQIYRYIESAAYGTARSELEELYEEGKNIDDVAFAFIDACMSDREYKRIPDAIIWLSEEYCEQNENLFTEIVQQMLESGKETRAEDVLKTMEGIGGVRARYAAAIRQELYGENHL